MKELIINEVDGVKQVKGVLTSNGEEYFGDLVLVACGSWTPLLLPHLSKYVHPTGQLVLHFKPENPSLFTEEKFPPFTSDISNTGFYGFPSHPMDGRVKIALHGDGFVMEEMTNEYIDKLLRRVVPLELKKHKKFLKESIKGFENAKWIGARLCLYCDSFDGDWLIDYDPNYVGLVVACGDSGHGFKFTPILGKIIADVIERKPNKYKSRLKWREVPNREKERSRFIQHDDSKL